MPGAYAHTLASLLTPVSRLDAGNSTYANDIEMRVMTNTWPDGDYTMKDDNDLGLLYETTGKGFGVVEVLHDDSKKIADMCRKKPELKPLESIADHANLDTIKHEIINKLSEALSQRKDFLEGVERKKAVNAAHYLLESAGEKIIGKKIPMIKGDRKSTRLNSSHTDISRMPSSA